MQRLSIFIFATLLCLTSCRGDKSLDPPILPVQNMVDQTSYAPQAPNNFFADKRATRSPEPNTVADNEAQIDSRFDKGLEPNSTAQNLNWVKQNPLKLNMDIMRQGQKNFNIYCSPCHGLSGYNDGLVTQRSGGSIMPAQLHAPEIIARPDGKIYDAVTNGVNAWNMPGFKAQLSAAERWAVVAYVRALQVSEHTMQTKKNEQSAPSSQQPSGPSVPSNQQSNEKSSNLKKGTSK